jgi:N-acetylglucosamine-6-sulfatase
VLRRGSATLVGTLVLGLATGLAPAGAAAQAEPDESEERPNVLVLVTDDQSVEAMRAMPRVQALLAAAGTTFDHALANYPLCCPARATLLTGQLAHNHGVLSNRAPTGGYGRLPKRNYLPVWLQRGATARFTSVAP